MYIQGAPSTIVLLSMFRSIDFSSNLLAITYSQICEDAGGESCAPFTSYRSHLSPHLLAIFHHDTPMSIHRTSGLLQRLANTHLNPEFILLRNENQEPKL